MLLLLPSCLKEELLGNLGVLDLAGIIEAHATDKLGKITAGSNGGTTSECLELDLGDLLGFRVDANLKLHDIATGGSTDKTGTDISILLVHGANISGSRVVVEDLLVVRARGVDGNGGGDLSGSRENGRASKRSSDGSSSGDGTDSSSEHCEYVNM
ncbi:hypothetical protein HG531_007479 [Fusarium graminearum]|nr:hypothetical protein HG531_007479 [Fusarium graminearum]